MLTYADVCPVSSSQTAEAPSSDAGEELERCSEAEGGIDGVGGGGSEAEGRGGGGGEGGEGEEGSGGVDGAFGGGVAPQNSSTYATFMRMVRQMLTGRMDSADFEENCRVLLGTSSFQVLRLSIVPWSLNSAE